MKITANSIVGKLARGILLIGVLTIIITGCTNVDSPFSVQETDVKSFEDLSINVKYAESYDQTTITYSRHWPSSISSGIEKTVSNSSGEFMVDYERIHEVVAFDEDGYMSTSTEFLEGDSETGMPESAYEEFKDQMPSHGIEHDPLVRIESGNGVERGYGKSGNILYEMEYNPEEFRVDISLLDSLNHTGDTSSSSGSIQNNILRLQNEGVNFDLIEGFYAKYNLVPTQEQSKYGIGLMQEVMDLRSGEIIASSIQSLDGKYLQVVESNYQHVNDRSVLSREVRYSFGIVNGKWGISTRTVTQREKIQVINN